MTTKSLSQTLDEWLALGYVVVVWKEGDGKVRCRVGWKCPECEYVNAVTKSGPVDCRTCGMRHVDTEDRTDA